MKKDNLDCLTASIVQCSSCASSYIAGSTSLCAIALTIEKRRAGHFCVKDDFSATI